MTRDRETGRVLSETREPLTYPQVLAEAKAAVERLDAARRDADARDNEAGR